MDHSFVARVRGRGLRLFLVSVLHVVRLFVFSCRFLVLASFLRCFFFSAVLLVLASNRIVTRNFLRFLYSNFDYRFPTTSAVMVPRSFSVAVLR